MIVALNNISSHVGIILYSWRSYVPNNAESSDDTSVPVLLNAANGSGVHYLNFSRSKNIGGNCEIDLFGAVHPSVKVGDWIVVKNSSSGEFTDANFRTHGITKFIGQIHSINTNFFADADGILRKTIKLSVREWSHVLHVPVRYDEFANTATNNLGAVSALQQATTNFQADNRQDVFLRLAYSSLNPFELVKMLLVLVGALSRNQSKIPGIDKRNEIATRLPRIPAALAADHVLLFQETGVSNVVEPEFDAESPWGTGFVWPLLGAQRWGGKTNIDSSALNASDWWDGVELDATGRPSTYTNVMSYTTGASFAEAAQNEAAMLGDFELYTDLGYAQDSSGDVKCFPTFVFRDKPLSFKRLWTEDKANKLEQEIPWTYLDYIPRTTIPLSHVVNINMTTSFTSAPNYTRLNVDNTVVLNTVANSQSYQEGTKTNLASQYRFGGMQREMILRKQVLGDTSDKSEDQKRTALNRVLSYVSCAASKMANFYHYNFLFPRASVEIKDDEFTVVVGQMIRIPLGGERPAMVGQVESVQFSLKVGGDGKQEQKTIVELSSVSCESEPFGELIPLPPRAAHDLFGIDVFRDTEYLEDWVFVD
jgi:hypothetical protein